jgi:hypothetical protein
MREIDKYSEEERKEIEDYIDRCLKLSPEERLALLEQMRKFALSIMDEKAITMNEYLHSL